MPAWVAVLVWGFAVAGAMWVVLLLAALALPSGLARDLARFIPDCLTTVRRLRRDPRVPQSAKVAVLVAAVWVASPIDLIPEFRVPREVLLEAWPGEPRLIERLLG